ncbi:restriction endonuclease [Curtobacterium sp. Arg-1]|uniref:restriction endonuclease n=1 Tax=Curtobacterium sp. Arg-1 TaxID=2935040 RepID=UPI0021DA5283|nr:restriction endonuclease [Curtobacterium sp. Arg-1]UXZ57977.1 restriction endonuclease [Curtobacterium sp. Arg-1]
MPAWKNYQESVADVFRDLGFTAETDKKVEGVRTSHDIDVVATYRHVGLDLLWVVECKLWKTRVSKLHVLALRTIVEDIGADRGLILSESGFQSGATEAAVKSNVWLAAVADFKHEAQTALERRRLLALPERIAAGNRRYWTIPKSLREETGLRPEGPTLGYSASNTLQTCWALVEGALAGILPPESRFALLPDVRTKAEAIGIAEALLDDLERRLDEAERQIPGSIWQEIETSRSEQNLAPSDDRTKSVARTLSILLDIPHQEAADRFDQFIEE